MSEKVKLISFETHHDNRRGNLSVMENIPFKVKRVFFVYEVPLSETRGGHAHKKCHQLLIAACGAVIIKTNGKDYVLDCPDIGLYVPPMNTINIIFLTDNAVLLVLASEIFDETDYVYGGING